MICALCVRIDPREIREDGGNVLVGEPEGLLLERALNLMEDPGTFQARIQALYADTSLEEQVELALKGVNDGRILERHTRALWGEYGKYLGRVCFFRDIAARKELEQSLEALSRRDPLTGVAQLDPGDPSVEVTLQCADQTHYRAKGSARNRVMDAAAGGR